MKAIRTLSVLVVFALVVGLLGCADNTNTAGTSVAPGASAAQSTSSADTKPVELEFYAWLDEEGIFTTLFDAYTALHPEITFNPHFTASNDYATKLVTIFSGGSDVDVFGVSSPPGLAEYQSMGQVMPLDDMIGQTGMDTSGYQATFDSIKIESNAYALPYKTSSWVVFYNKDIFDAAGVPYPSGDWTWEEYYEVAGKLTSGEGADKIYGSLNYQPTSTWWRVPANSKRSNNPLEPAMLDDWLEAAKFSLNLSQAGYQPPYADKANEAGADYSGAFLQGKYGMMFNGDWCIEMLNTKIAQGETLNYDIAPLPHWDGVQPETTGAPGLLMVADRAKNPSEAFSFISFCAGAEGADILVHNDYLPAWQSDEIISVYTSNKEVPEHVSFILSQSINSQVPVDSMYNMATNIVKEEVSLYLLEEQDLDATKAAIEKRFASDIVR